MSTALVVMDLQREIFDRYPEQGPALTHTVRRAVDHAHQSGVTVIFVRVAFRNGFPEIGSGNSTFWAGRQPPMTESDPSTQFVAGIGQTDEDIVVIKRRISAFSGTDFEMILRAQRVTDLVLCGISTSGCVLSTLRQAADLDYRITVLRDACIDGDPVVQEVLLNTIFPRQATVCTVDEWITQ